MSARAAASAIPATQPTALPAGLTREQLLEIYYYLRLTRTLEERLVALYRQSKVIGGLFRSLGQEGSPWRQPMPWSGAVTATFSRP